MFLLLTVSILTEHVIAFLWQHFLWILVLYYSIMHLELNVVIYHSTYNIGEDTLLCTTVIGSLGFTRYTALMCILSASMYLYNRV